MGIFRKLFGRKDQILLTEPASFTKVIEASAVKAVKRPAKPTPEQIRLIEEEKQAKLRATAQKALEDLLYAANCQIALAHGGRCKVRVDANLSIAQQAQVYLTHKGFKVEIETHGGGSLIYLRLTPLMN